MGGGAWARVDASGPVGPKVDVSRLLLLIVVWGRNPDEPEAAHMVAGDNGEASRSTRFGDCTALHCAARGTGSQAWVSLSLSLARFSGVTTHKFNDLLVSLAAVAFFPRVRAWHAPVPEPG